VSLKDKDGKEAEPLAKRRKIAQGTYAELEEPDEGGKMEEEEEFIPESEEEEDESLSDDGYR
jgi:hypothetical protein